MTLGQYLREQRTAKGIGLRELARRVKVHHSTLSHLEGDRRLIGGGEKVLHRLAQELNVDPNYLLVLAGYLPPKMRRVLINRPELIRFVCEHATEADRESGAFSTMGITNGKSGGCLVDTR